MFLGYVNVVKCCVCVHACIFVTTYKGTELWNWKRVCAWEGQEGGKTKGK